MTVTSGKNDCGKEPGVVIPVIDRTKCEGKEDCVRVCPYDVFAVRQLAKTERAALPITARVKAWAHGNRQAFAVHADQCHGCGLCVSACPEHAIRLSRV
jgi:4Fe-4S ferredoxin